MGILGIIGLDGSVGVQRPCTAASLGIVILLLSSCASSRSSLHRERWASRFGSGAEDVPPLVSNEERRSPFPWDTVAFPQDPVASRYGAIILRGDERYHRGDYEAARREYQSIDSATVLGHPGLLSRLVATHLALGQAAAGLRLLEQSVATQRLPAEAVDPMLMMMFGFCQGQRANIDESLGWFAFVAEHPGRSLSGRSLSGEARKSIAALLRTFSDDQLEQSSREWIDSDIVREMIAHERGRRAKGIPGISRNPFQGIQPTRPGAEAPTPSTSDSGQPTAESSATERVIGFLPLSGSFASMGRSIERGLSCGLEKSGGVQALPLTVVDAGASDETSLNALADAARQLPPPAALVGPFLSTQISDVVSLSQAQGLVAYNISKGRSPKGDAVFDVGFTVPDQLRALVDQGILRAGVTRLAIARTSAESSRKIVAELREALAGSGISILFDGEYGDSDEFGGVRDIVTKLEETAVEGVFIADTARGASRLLSSMGSALRRRVKIFGPGAWYNLTALKNAQGAFDNAIFPVPFLVSEREELFQTLDSCLPARRNRSADFLSALGFDVGTIIIRRRAGEAGSYRGLTGDFNLTEQNVERTILVGSFVKGSLRAFRPVIRSLDDVKPSVAGAPGGDEQAGAP